MTTPTKKLSPAQDRVLWLVREGRDPYDGIYGRSAHGGMACTLMALRRKGLLTGNDELTIDGNEYARGLK